MFVIRERIYAHPVYSPQGFNCLKPTNKMDSEHEDRCAIPQLSHRTYATFHHSVKRKTSLHKSTRPLRKSQSWFLLNYSGKFLYFILLV